MLAKYLMELTLVDYDMVHYNPSEIAAAALCLAQKILSQGYWVRCYLNAKRFSLAASQRTTVT